MYNKKNHSTSEWVVFCILMVSFSVYYLGVYMFWVNELFIFSVSTTLKSYIIILAQQKLYVNKLVLHFNIKPEKHNNGVYSTLYKN